MMYIGTSLGGCLKSLMAGEVSFDDVLFIVTRTRAAGIDNYLKVVTQYYNEGNYTSRTPDKYDLSFYTMEDVLEMANRLWYSGKIHQPRVGISEGGGFGGVNYVHPDLYDNLWLEIIPPHKLNNPVVKDLWDKVKMTVALTNEDH